MHLNAITPLPYSAAVEKIDDDEPETIAELIETLKHISHITFKDSGHGMRSVHAKSHGLLTGKLQVLSGLPAAYAQGLFAEPKVFPIVMRFSTSPGDMLSDRVSTPRGLALKVIGVEGARLAGSEGDVTQDFLMVNGPAFLKPDAKSFLSSLKLLAATTDKAPGAKAALSAVLRGTEKAVEALGGESATLKSMGGHPETNILGETFYSQVPLRYGAFMAKMSIAPVCLALTALKDAPVDLSDHPDGLRDEVSKFFKAGEGEWELRAQLCNDLDSMPIEDASVKWPEDKSPYVAVARISVESQVTWSAEREALQERLSFSPWHGLAAHRPLGSIMRARREAYVTMAKVRAEQNSVVVDEPRSVEDVKQ